MNVTCARCGHVNMINRRPHLAGPTKLQADLLAYLLSYMSESLVAPSFAEMREHMGLKSKSGVHRLLTGLEERGFIRRLPYRARAIEITDEAKAMLERAAA